MFPIFFASSVTFVLSFLKGDNASRYIATPAIIDAFYNRHFSTHPPTIIICYKLQHLFHFTHQLPMHAKASFRNSLPPNYILTPIRSYVHITPFFRISWIPSSFTFFIPLSFLINTTCAEIIIHLTHQYMYLRTRAYRYVFFKGLKQISSSTPAQV